MLWYSALFAKPWMTETGVGDAKAASPLKTCVPVLILNLVAATSLAMFIGAGDWRFGLFAGVMAWLAFVSVAFGMSCLFEGRSLRLWLINSGYHTLFFSVMGLMIGAWH